MRIHLGDLGKGEKIFSISWLRQSQPLLMVCDDADDSLPEAHLEIVYALIIQAKVVMPDITAEWKFSFIITLKSVSVIPYPGV